MRRIAVVNQKGGCAKTVTATCLAVGLARRGHKTLLIDCDSQANATWTMLGGQGAESPTLASVLMRQASPEDAIRPTRVEGLDILPADASLSGVNVALVQELGRDTRLRSAMAPMAEAWAFVILDTAPTFTTVLANALVYAGEILVPVDPGVYAMLGLVQLQETIEEVRDAYGNQELHLAGLLLTRVTRNNVARDVEAEIRGRFGGTVYQPTIPLNAKVEEACTRALTVVEYAPRSAAAMAYDALVTEVLSDGGTKDGGRTSSVRRAGTIDSDTDAA